MHVQSHASLTRLVHETFSSSSSNLEMKRKPVTWYLNGARNLIANEMQDNGNAVIIRNVTGFRQGKVITLSIVNLGLHVRGIFTFKYF